MLYIVNFPQARSLQSTVNSVSALPEKYYMVIGMEIGDLQWIVRFNEEWY